MIAFLRWAIYIVAGIFCIMIPVKFTNYLYYNKKVKINRWVIGAIAPLVLIIPSALFKNIPSVIWNILLMVFTLLVVMFFEVTRLMIENKKLKGLVDYSSFIKKDNQKLKAKAKGKVFEKAKRRK